ncbi:hypothetical protein I7I51_05821 [Histoplasma capsulatum]|uniref:Uncharacterized protein n=1 Tax=Ajellomyces capsulatus TaxID=5037 RepID=A0A8A1M8S3_AJECA|nr:predicted protein [Histoplasma mississippiense (nom. inval.)]EDN05214.1 predicted protein [Histoplasma mississippiense (nom. inval.)]QSS61014.1 hypothetical protein I7I51_05821 [Histoplasma capsulatum]
MIPVIHGESSIVQKTPRSDGRMIVRGSKGHGRKLLALLASDRTIVNKPNLGASATFQRNQTSRRGQTAAMGGIRPQEYTTDDDKAALLRATSCAPGQSPGPALSNFGTLLHPGLA